MLRTGLCDLLGIKHPIIQASLGPWSSAKLTAAVSNAGGLGSFGTAQIPLGKLEERLTRLRRLTDAPFAVNHTVRPLDEEAFDLTLEVRPRVVSLALGDPGDLVGRTHEAGVLFMQQVHTVRQAERAAARGVDVIVAQGSEAGGFGGSVGAMALIPQVVDAVAPTPVVAAGGIADGRGLAAALVLGAQGVNVGTRFVASDEAAVAEDWKGDILSSHSEDAVRVEFANEVFPPPSREGGYETFPRVLRTPFVDHWNLRRDEARREAEHLREDVMAAVGLGRAHELVPFTGQTAGMIRAVLPAGEIVRTMVAEAEAALMAAAGTLRTPDPTADLQRRRES